MNRRERAWQKTIPKIIMRIIYLDSLPDCSLWFLQGPRRSCRHHIPSCRLQIHHHMRRYIHQISPNLPTFLVRYYGRVKNYLTLILADKVTKIACVRVSISMYRCPVGSQCFFLGSPACVLVRVLPIHLLATTGAH